MGAVAEDLVRERAALRATLMEVGPDAPTNCGDWTATDLAVHVAIGEMSGGLATAPFRLMVAHGLRLDRVAKGNTRVLKTYRRRRGFDWAIDKLAKPPPRAVRTGSIGIVSLLEVWAHHEDVLLANGVECTSGVDLAPVVELLTHYQRKVIAAHGLEITGSLADQARVLAGRADCNGVRLKI